MIFRFRNYIFDRINVLIVSLSGKAFLEIYTPKKWYQNMLFLYNEAYLLTFDFKFNEIENNFFVSFNNTNLNAHKSFLN